MSLLVVVLTLLLLAAVIAVISAPLRAVWSPRDDRSPDGADLETAREAKYREIRDLELDYRTGKLSSEDYQATDGALRAEALEILNRLQELEGATSQTETSQREPSRMEASRRRTEGAEPRQTEPQADASQADAS